MSSKRFFVFLIVSAFIYTGVASALEFRTLKSTLTGGCVTPFGQAVGKDATGVLGISNCNDSYVSNSDSYIQTKFGPIYSGMQWQCVEYARRWLIANRLVSFDSVDIAAQIWDLPSINVVQHPNAPTPARKLPFPGFASGVSTSAPAVGCLLIYNTKLAPTGHVAVISAVDVAGGSVRVAEQNWFNDVWPGDYARALKLTRSAQNGAFTIEDDFVIGWKCVLE